MMPAAVAVAAPGGKMDNSKTPKATPATAENLGLSSLVPKPCCQELLISDAVLAVDKCACCCDGDGVVRCFQLLE